MYNSFKCNAHRIVVAPSKHICARSNANHRKQVPYEQRRFKIRTKERLVIVFGLI